jgi:hypothetical protein
VEEFWMSGNGFFEGGVENFEKKFSTPPSKNPFTGKGLPAMERLKKTSSRFPYFII